MKLARSSEQLLTGQADTALRHGGLAWMKLAATAAAFVFCSSAIALPEDKGSAAQQAFLPAGSAAGSAGGSLRETAKVEPAPPGRIEAVAPFAFAGNAAARANATDCLAAAGIYEAGDDADGQRAVMQVVLNRARHPAYPDSICAVVFEGAQRQTGCQFTFTCDGSLARDVPRAAWSRAKAVAGAALDGYVDGRVGSATHYHADYVNPHWAGSLQRLATVGRHRFYRFSGRIGSAAALGRAVHGDRRLFADLVRTARDRPPSAAPALAPASTSAAAPIHAVQTSPRVLPAGTHVAALDMQQAPGRWAVLAMNACRAQDDCIFLGYAGADEALAARAAPAPDRALPLFALVKDAASGAQLPFWDCDRVQAPRADSCLPTNAAQRSRLLRDRE